MQTQLPLSRHVLALLAAFAFVGAENIHTESFDRDPDWDGLNHRTIAQEIGFDFAGVNGGGHVILFDHLSCLDGSPASIKERQSLSRVHPSSEERAPTHTLHAIPLKDAPKTTIARAGGIEMFS